MFPYSVARLCSKLSVLLYILLHTNICTNRISFREILFLHAFCTSRPIKTAPLVSKIKYALCAAVTAAKCNKQEKLFCISACFLFVYISFCLFVCFQRDAVVENIFELMHTAGKTEQGRRGAKEENPALCVHPQVSYSPNSL